MSITNSQFNKILAIMFFIKIFKDFNTIILVIVVTILSIFLKDILSTNLKIFFYSLSYIINKLLIFFLPLLILPLTIKSILQIKMRGAYFVLVILILIFVSNFLSLMIAYFFGTKCISKINVMEPCSINLISETINTFYNFDLPPVITIPQIMLIGLLLGVIFSYIHAPKITKFVDWSVNLSKLFFEKIFINLLPIYIFGTMLKITHETDFLKLILSFGSIILLITVVIVTYICLLFYIGTRNFRQSLQAISNALPAGMIGFATMSSLITMPVTLKSAIKNTQNSDLAQMTIGMTVNCHDIGDCISLPLIALTLNYMTMQSLPSLENYIYFAVIIAVAQFSAVSIPGGSIAILLPFLSSQFNFTDDMLSLLIVLSIFIEPLGTAGNVMGNSAFVILVDKLYNKLNFSHQKLNTNNISSTNSK